MNRSSNNTRVGAEAATVIINFLLDAELNPEIKADSVTVDPSN